MFSDAQRHDGAPAQWYQREESNDQSIPICECLCLGGFGETEGICHGPIHQFDAEGIKSIAGDEMVPFGSWWRLMLDAFGDGQQP